MQINKVDYIWKGQLQKREETKYIIIHHAAATTASPEDIHSWHLSNGWSGIGYNFVIRKDGSVYQGRPIDTIGAHAEGWNSTSVGICFEGNLNQEKLTEVQTQSGIELIRYIRGIYKGITVLRHKDVNPGKTDCPGENFPNAVIYEGMKDIEKEHWAEPAYKKLLDAGYIINEKRFDDKISRGEVFALLSQKICKG